MLARLASRIAAHPRRTLAALAVVLGLLGGLAAAFGGSYRDDFRVPASDAQRALDLLEERFPQAAGDTATVVFAVPDGAAGAVTDPARAGAITAALDEVAGQAGVTAVVSPLAPDGAGQVSADGRIAFAAVQYAGTADELGRGAGERLADAVAPAAGADLEVSRSGLVVDQAEASGGIPVGEVIGVGVALVVLLLVFRSVLAMVLTLGSALLAVGAALAVLLLGADAADLPTLAPTLAVMLGLGAGIDYALLVVARYRGELAAGADARTALATALSTAGRSVLVAGAIVVVAIAGLFVTGIPFVGRMGLAAAVAVAIVAVGAITLLPTLLAVLGRRLTPSPRAAATAQDSPAFRRWGRLLVRRRWPVAVAASAVLLALAAPVLGLRLGQPDDGNRPESATQRVAYDRIAEGFGAGTNGPLLLAVALPDDPAAGERALTALAERAAADPGVAAVAPPSVNERGDAAVLTVVPASAPQDAATADLVERLRSDIAPAATAGTGAVVHVGGATAVLQDLADRIADRLPLFVALVVAVSVLLLVVVFRSVLVPLVSAVFTLLSVLAAYGVVVLVFQRGWGAGLLGVDGEVPVVSFIPLFLFALLFGLSMDYNVFLQSRIREERDAGRTARDAVVAGVAGTGRVIAAAGAIMVAVFGAFVTDDDVTTKMIGLGLAAAILIDVVLVRFLLAPAVMALLGDRAWWLPRWLDRVLPQVRLEGGAPDAAVPAPAPAGAR